MEMVGRRFSIYSFFLNYIFLFYSKGGRLKLKGHLEMRSIFLVFKWVCGKGCGCDKILRLDEGLEEE